MIAASRFRKQIAEIVFALDAASIPFALIGGFAPVSHKVIRATRDIDLLIDGIEDCQVCCRPINPAVAIDGEGVTVVEVSQEDEV